MGCRDVAAGAVAAAAQNFKHVVTFGDSGWDSGYYKSLASPGGGAVYDADWRPQWPTAPARRRPTRG